MWSEPGLWPPASEARSLALLLCLVSSEKSSGLYPEGEKEDVRRGWGELHNCFFVSFVLISYFYEILGFYLTFSSVPKFLKAVAMSAFLF